MRKRTVLFGKADGAYGRQALAARPGIWQRNAVKRMDEPDGRAWGMQQGWQRDPSAEDTADQPGHLQQPKEYWVGWPIS